MIQVIKKDYKNLDSAIEDINRISIRYDYFKDYSVIASPSHESYAVLLKFDVPKNYNCLCKLDLANIKSKGSFHVLDFEYKIELNDKELEEKTWPKSIRCKVYNEKLVEIIADFGIKDFIHIVGFKYIDEGLFKNKYIKVSLNEFEISSYLGCEVSKERETIICENVDYKLIYDHIVSVYLQRGYLLDIDGLHRFNDVLKMVCDLINKRNLEHESIV